MKDAGVGKALLGKLRGLMEEYENGDKNDKILCAVFEVWSAEKK